MSRYIIFVTLLVALMGFTISSLFAQDDIADALLLDQLRTSVTESDPPTNPDEVVESVIQKYQLWPINSVIVVCFYDGDVPTKEFVESEVGKWNELMSSRFEFRTAGSLNTCVERNSGHIRVRFSSTVNNSYVGTDALDTMGNTPTMNLGDLRLGVNQANESRARRVVLHEFGHALGFEHEHQSPSISCWERFDKPVVLEYYRTSQGWNEEKTKRNLQSLTKGTHLSVSQFDPKSIMYYRLPAWFFTNGDSDPCFVEEAATRLSELDKVAARRAYPFSQSERNSYIDDINKEFVLSSLDIDSDSANAGNPVALENKSLEGILEETLKGLIEKDLITSNRFIDLKISGNNTTATAISGTAIAVTGPDSTININSEKPKQPQQSMVSITPIVENEVTLSEVRTTQRDGVSTGSLIEKKCKSFSYGATNGWNIDPQSVVFVDIVSQGESERRVTGRSSSSITVEYCAKSRVEKLNKRTGDSFAKVRYTETRTENQNSSGDTLQSVIIAPNTGATIVLPDNTIGFSGSVSTDSGSIDISGEGKFGNYSAIYNSINRMLTVQWAP